MIGNIILGGTKAVKKSQPLAPTREVLSFRTYTARRKMARLRRCACLLYQSEPLGHVIRKIEAEVENGRLAIRPDKKLHADLGKCRYCKYIFIISDQYHQISLLPCLASLRMTANGKNKVSIL